MSRQLQDIFEECVERLQQGDSIENCLMRYPEVAADLEILLRTALNVNWRASIVQPRPEFKARARAQFIGAQYYAAQVPEVKQRPTFFSLQRAWVPALAMVLILVLSSVGTAAASNAMPDEPLYPVKLATEQVQLTLAFSDEAKADLNAKLAETRSQEIVVMATQGKPEQVIAATERLVKNIEAAEVAIQRVETKQTPANAPKAATPAPSQPAPTAPSPSPTAPAPAPSTSSTPEKPKDATRQAGEQPAPSQEKVTVTEAEKLRQVLKATISKNLTAMEDAHDKAPEKSKEALQRAIEMAKKRQSQLQQPSTETQNKPAVTPPTPTPIQPKPGQDPKNPRNVPDSSSTRRGE